MIERCTNPANASYRRYGAQGVEVCARWASLENFVADMGLRPAGFTLDRIDSTGHYSPQNCRWASVLQQQRNRRNVKCTEELAALIRADLAAGKTQREIAARVGLSQAVVSRIANNRIWR
jgi:hypothetical protein